MKAHIPGIPWAVTWLGVILMACGAALLVAVRGGTAQELGAAFAIVGALLVVAGACRAILRLVARRRLGYGGDDEVAAVTADYRTGCGKLAVMVLVVAYLFSPVDLAVLELLLPVGVVGDAGAVAWLLTATGKEVSRHRQARRLRREGGQAITRR